MNPFTITFPSNWQTEVAKQNLVLSIQRLCRCCESEADSKKNKKATDCLGLNVLFYCYEKTTDALCSFCESLCSPCILREDSMPDLAGLETMMARFATSGNFCGYLAVACPGTASARQPCRAGWIMDSVFLRQVWAGNPSMLLDLLERSNPSRKARLHYFLINKGPWSRLDHNIPSFRALRPNQQARIFILKDHQRIR